MFNPGGQVLTRWCLGNRICYWPYWCRLKSVVVSKTIEAQTRDTRKLYKNFIMSIIKETGGCLTGTELKNLAKRWVDKILLNCEQSRSQI